MKMKMGKVSPDDDLGDGLGDTFFIFLKSVAQKVSKFKHFIGFLMNRERFWETGEIFC